jgi:DNA invertase Pin-like site-specific DNA recombinase
LIGVYVRVSTSGQKSYSQRVEIQRWLDAHGYTSEAVQWFEDIQTGKTMARPALQALQKAVFDGSVKTVVVWKLDRLARNFREGVEVVCDWCQKGIRVVSVTQQIDLDGTVGRMVAGVLFAIAEIELQHIQERQAIGIAVAKKKGIYTGRALGTTKAKPERARALRKQGLTYKEIAVFLNVSERTIYNYVVHKVV